MLYRSKKSVISLRDCKEYSEALRISNKKLQQANAIIEKSSIVVFEWSMGTDLPVKFVTKNISLFGYTQEDFYSGEIDYWDFVYEEDRKKTMDQVWTARKEKLTEYKHTYRVRCKSGEIRWVEEWTLLERNEDGEPLSEKGILQDITDRKLAEEKIHHLTFHDKLTGLYNRAYYDEILQKLHEAQEYPFSLILGDMNGLKVVNDALGHKAGDTLLYQTALIIKQACREEDIAARLGGDEFAILLPNASTEIAMEICNKIRHLCSCVDNDLLKPNIALGYSTVNSTEDTIEEALKEADHNMYHNKLNERKSVRSSIIVSLQTSLEKKTLETKEHGERIKETALKLGKALGLSDNQMDELALASTMHDIGKIAIPDDILLKTEKLNDKEWETIKKHPEIGYHIIVSSQNMTSIADYILAHHERWDGSGYPRNLKALDIPMLSRIISIADSYDVMIHNRPYCRARSKNEALEEIKRCAGSQFDPNLVEIFLTII